MTATSQQLVGKLAMTVLKMRPKLGHISRMLLARSREEIPDNLSEIITKKDTGKSWAKLAQLFYNDFRPSWDEVEKGLLRNSKEGLSGSFSVSVKHGRV